MNIRIVANSVISGFGDEDIQRVMWSFGKAQCGTSPENSTDIYSQLQEIIK